MLVASAQFRALGLNKRLDTAEISFFAVRSPRFWVSGYCTKWRIQGSFHSSYSRLLNVKTQETQYLASILSDTFVKCMSQHRLCTRKMDLALEVKFMSTFTEFTRLWWRTLTNGSDVKNVFPLTDGSDVNYVFPRCQAVAGSHNPSATCRVRWHQYVLRPQCLSSTTAFGIACSYLSRLEEQGVGAQWSNLYTSPMSGDGFSLGYALGMMMIDGVIYGLLTWYIEAVNPGKSVLITWPRIIQQQRRLYLYPCLQKNVSYMGLVK